MNYLIALDFDNTKDVTRVILLTVVAYSPQPLAKCNCRVSFRILVKGVKMRISGGG